MSVYIIHDLVREGRITPEQAAMLLQMRRDLQRARRPRIVKFFSFIGRLVFG